MTRVSNRRRRRRALVGFGLPLLVLILVNGFLLISNPYSHHLTPYSHHLTATPSIAASGSPTGVTGAVAPQTAYVIRLSQDYHALDRGVLLYSPIGTLKTGADLQFEVEVADVGRGRQRLRVSAFGGWDVYPRDVPTGGIVGVKIVACQNLTCRSESSDLQPVLQPGQAAQWYWQITAGNPGPALITLRANTYDQGSGQSLQEEVIFVKVKVVATPTFTHKQRTKKIQAAANNVVGIIVTIGSVATAIAAVGTILGWIFVKTRRRKDVPAGGEDAAVHGPAEPSPGAEPNAVSPGTVEGKGDGAH